MTTITIHRGQFSLPLKILLAVVAGAVLVTWMYYTPPGLLGKADAIGYAVCHRISARSFFIGDRPLPLCVRCSGMYLGALLGFLYLFRQGRQGGLPTLKISLVLGAFLLAFGFDGVNSYLHLVPNAPTLYEPQNWLRLMTGTALGMGMASMLYPIFNQSMWADWNNIPVLHSWRQMLELFVLASLLIAIVWSQNPLILYPLALLSAGTVVLMLTLIYSIVWAMLTKQENHFHGLSDMWPILLAGLITAMLQIGLMDIGRFALTGTWAGFFSS
ncbi:MAG: DUF2085 domain-containing protein [Chloroflexi bacterium]|nr:DUF2085 domain-containing protein [Chloroflexota bacterium]